MPFLTSLALISTYKTKIITKLNTLYLKKQYLCARYHELIA